MTRRKFLIETFDYTTALWPKPLVEAEALTQMAGKLIIRESETVLATTTSLASLMGSWRTIVCPSLEETQAVMLATVSYRLTHLGDLLFALIRRILSMYRPLRNFRIT